ncbi:Transcription termination factor 5 like protein [Argiope bruennichi]|uniref:Transcription termination factor 5 like protein n=1 Tax=Argiope bruennichi TaxID=94029 RepID=A0A8T0FN81_ARGBR|nr:Transcription termination factor 5 like protein [Argiope bruennichi]
MNLESSLLQHRYFSLKELGCSNLSAYNILTFPQIIKQTPKVLAENNIHFDFHHELDHFMSFLSSCDLTDQNEIKLRLEKMFQDDSSMWKIREAMNAEFISSKLNCSLAKAHQLFRRYPPLRLQSVSNTAHLLDLLFQRLKFTIPKVFQAPKLLSVHYETAEYFLDKLPEILGIDIIELTQKYPLILRRSINTIREVEEILRKFNITDKQVLNCPKIISFTPRTLEERLEYLCTSEDFALLKSYKKFLWLVYHYGNLNTRLEALKALDLPRSINAFIATNSNFQNYLSFSKSRSNVDDVCQYLAEFFKCSTNDVSLKLREFPNAHNACLANTTQIVHFLLGAGVTKQQIYKGLGIILYNFDIVKDNFKELRNSPALINQPFTYWISHYNLIQLLIYTIERKNNFKESRSYKVNSKYLDSNELAISSYG